MTKLLVNIDHVATLRNARGEGYPDPSHAARICEQAGAAGIVFHLRGDRRHIRDEDLPRLKQAVKGKLDFEMAATDEMLGICCALGPELCTLVPEGREELTTEGGLNLSVVGDDLRDRAIPRLKKAGIEVSLFLDPVESDIREAARIGADAVELHTGRYANLHREQGAAAAEGELARLAEAARLGRSLGLTMNAGHGLNLDNLEAFLRAAGPLNEVSIGHALISEALYRGFGETVSAYIALIRRSRVA